MAKVKFIKAGILSDYIKVKLPNGDERWFACSRKDKDFAHLHFKTGYEFDVTVHVALPASILTIKKSLFQKFINLFKRDLDIHSSYEDRRINPSNE